MARTKRDSRAGNVAIIRSVLKAEGFSEYGIAGALARMRQESAFNPRARNKGDGRDGSDSIGIFQWNSDRAKRLRAFARRAGKSWDDIATQARFFAWEAKNDPNERKYGARLISARSTDEAAKAAISMARPQGWKANNPAAGHGFSNTLRWTKNLGVKGVEPLTLHARDSSAPTPGELDIDMAGTGSAGGRRYERANEPRISLEQFLGLDPTLQSADAGTAELMTAWENFKQMNAGLDREAELDSREQFGPHFPADFIEDGLDFPDAPLDGDPSPGSPFTQILAGIFSNLEFPEQPEAKTSHRRYSEVMKAGLTRNPMAEAIAGMIRGFTR